MNELLKEILEDYVSKNSQINLNSGAARENLAAFIVDELDKNDYIIANREEFELVFE